MARRQGPWKAIIAATIAVPWMFLWLIPLVAALEMPVGWASAALVGLTGVFIWWNVLRPLRSGPRTATFLRLRPWRRYASWLAVAAAAQFSLGLATLALHEQLAAWSFLPRLPVGPDLVPAHFLTHPLGPPAMVLAAVILTPLIEEFACRGRMQYRLEKALGVIPSILIPAVVFCALHGILVAPHHLPFAVFVGWVVWRTGSIWTAVFVHALNNAGGLALIYLGPQSEILSQDVPEWLWPYAIAVGLIALGVLLAATWRIDQRARPERAGRKVWIPGDSLEKPLTRPLRG